MLSVQNFVGGPFQIRHRSWLLDPQHAPFFLDFPSPESNAELDHGVSFLVFPDMNTVRSWHGVGPCNQRQLRYCPHAQDPNFIGLGMDAHQRVAKFNDLITVNRPADITVFHHY